MLDFAWSELMIIGVVTLVVVGPKDLPFVLRTAGRWMGKARAMAREFQNNVDDMIREAELHEVHKQIADMSKINPLAGIENSLNVNPYPAPAIADPDVAHPLITPAADAPAPVASPAGGEATAHPSEPEKPAPEHKA
jgi:sec-independent protein translocase protein TatB